MVMRPPIKLALLVLAPVIGALIIWAGLLLALGAEHPVLVVKGHSMEPTLMPGDLLFVQAIDIRDVRAGPDGDIVAFYQPGSGRTRIVVHRALEKIVGGDGSVLLRTKGDNVAMPDSWYVTEEELIGKVVFRMPLIGALVEFIRSPIGVCIVALIYGIFLVEVSSASLAERAHGGDGSRSGATPAGSSGSISPRRAS